MSIAAPPTGNNKLPIGSYHWTTVPTVYQETFQDMDSVPAWYGYVVKQIGASVWLRQADHEDLEPDPTGTFTGIAHVKQLFGTEQEANDARERHAERYVETAEGTGPSTGRESD
jgi:hypothetical protein